MLSCIRYQEAHDLISKISNVCSREAYFFISAGGLHTEVGREYSDRALPIEARWGKTSPEMAQKHQLFAPECLYAEEDLVALLTSCGLEVVRAWTSEFGNPKAICRR